jgi:hypothetical protein
MGTRFGFSDALRKWPPQSAVLGIAMSLAVDLGRTYAATASKLQRRD